MSEFEELLQKIAAVLEKTKIPYIVTGGAAVVTWGKPRFTADIDISVELQSEHIDPLVRELRSTLGSTAYIDEQMIRKEWSRRGEFNVIHPESGLKVDFFVRYNDAFEKGRLERARVCEVGGQKVRFISPEDLILVKLRWYQDSESTRHLEDARSVVAIQGERLDRDYIRRWAAEQGTSDLLEKIEL